MSKAPLIYVETSVFLAYFSGEKGRADICKEQLDQGRRGEKRIVTSVFTLVEVLRAKGGQTVAPAIEEQIDRFFQHSWLSLRQLERVLAIKARRLARQFSLKAGDAIHLATALDCGATKLLTYDDDLLDLEKSGITTEEPKGQGSLPLQDSTRPRRKK